MGQRKRHNSSVSALIFLLNRLGICVALMVLLHWFTAKERGPNHFRTVRKTVLPEAQASFLETWRKLMYHDLIFLLLVIGHHTSSSTKQNRVSLVNIESITITAKSQHLTLDRKCFFIIRGVPFHNDIKWIENKCFNKDWEGMIILAQTQVI